MQIKMVNKRLNYEEEKVVVAALIITWFNKNVMTSCNGGWLTLRTVLVLSCV